MRYLFLLFMAFMGVSAHGQMALQIKPDDGHVKWTFTISEKENKYTIHAMASLENGWHVFSANPGGDGSLTSTQIEVNEIMKLKAPVEFREEGHPIEKDMEGIGVVKYFENQASFSITFAAPDNIKSFTGNIAYQICNDKMCMAPATKLFSVTIK